MENYQMPTRLKYRETDVLNCDTELLMVKSKLYKVLFENKCSPCQNLSEGRGRAGGYLISVERVKSAKTGPRPIAPRWHFLLWLAGFEPLTSRSAIRLANYCATGLSFLHRVWLFETKFIIRYRKSSWNITHLEEWIFDKFLYTIWLIRFSKAFVTKSSIFDVKRVCLSRILRSEMTE